MSSIARFVDCQLNPVEKAAHDEDVVDDLGVEIGGSALPAKKKLKMQENDDCGEETAVYGVEASDLVNNRCNISDDNSITRRHGLRAIKERNLKKLQTFDRALCCGTRLDHDINRAQQQQQQRFSTSVNGILFESPSSPLKEKKIVNDPEDGVKYDSEELHKFLPVALNTNNNNNNNNCSNHDRSIQKIDSLQSEDNNSIGQCREDEVKEPLEPLMGSGDGTGFGDFAPSTTPTTPTAGGCSARSRRSKQTASSSKSSRFVYPGCGDLLRRHNSNNERSPNAEQSNFLTKTTTTTTTTAIKSDVFTRRRRNRNVDSDQKESLTLTRDCKDKQHSLLKESSHNVAPGLIISENKYGDSNQNGSKVSLIKEPPDDVVVMIKDEFDASDDLDFSAINSQLLKKEEDCIQIPNKSNLKRDSRSARMIRDISSNFGVGRQQFCSTNQLELGISALSQSEQNFSAGLDQSNDLKTKQVSMSMNQSNYGISALPQSEQDFSAGLDQSNGPTTKQVSMSMNQSNYGISALPQSEKDFAAGLDQSDATIKGTCIDSPTVDLFGDENLSNVSEEEVQLSPCLANQGNTKVDKNNTQSQKAETAGTSKVSKKLFDDNKDSSDDDIRIQPVMKTDISICGQSDAFDKDAADQSDAFKRDINQSESTKDVVRRRKKGKRITRNLRRSARKGSFSAAETENNNSGGGGDEKRSKVRKHFCVD